MISGQKIPMTANGAITAFRIVTPGNAAREAAQAAAATAALLGVAEFTVADGEDATIQLSGVATVEAGAAVAVGARITSDSQGRGVAAAPVAGTNNGIIGVAVTAAAGAGELIEVVLQPGTFQG